MKDIVNGCRVIFSPLGDLIQKGVVEFRKWYMKVEAATQSKDMLFNLDIRAWPTLWDTRDLILNHLKQGKIQQHVGFDVGKWFENVPTNLESTYGLPTRMTKMFTEVVDMYKKPHKQAPSICLCLDEQTMLVEKARIEHLRPKWKSTR